VQLTFQELQNVLDSPLPQIRLLFAAFIIIKGKKMPQERAFLSSEVYTKCQWKTNTYCNTQTPATLCQAKLTWQSSVALTQVPFFWIQA